jgi:uncharacterized protein (DUF1684 family)
MSSPRIRARRSRSGGDERAIGLLDVRYGPVLNAVASRARGEQADAEAAVLGAPGGAEAPAAHFTRRAARRAPEILSWWIRAGALGAALAGAPALDAQLPAALARERGEYAEWLASAPVSPHRAIAQQPIGGGIRLGPADADVPLTGVSEHRLVQRGGAVTLEDQAGRRAVPRGLPIRLGEYTLTVDGDAGRAVVTVFDGSRQAPAPSYFDYQPSLVLVGPLSPPARHRTVRVLGIDGIEVEAAEAGTVLVPVGGAHTRLRVLRLPTSGGEESELEIYFRDETSGKGSYPAGRFVSLVPRADGRYRLDFNRARNPCCAYSSAYPCPAPWRGNAVPSRIDAGERYAGGGLTLPSAAEEVQ